MENKFKNVKTLNLNINLFLNQKLNHNFMNIKFLKKFQKQNSTNISKGSKFKIFQQFFFKPSQN